MEVQLGLQIVMIKMGQTYEQKKQDLKNNLHFYSDVNRNVHMVKKLKVELQELEESHKESSKKKKSEGKKYDAAYYFKKTVVELKNIAKKLGVSKYYSLKEKQLVKEIMKRQ